MQEQEVILLMDDDESSHDSLCELFQDKYKIIEVDSGGRIKKEILKQLHTYAIALVAIHICTDEFSKLECLVKTCPAHIPVILFLDEPALGLEERCYELGDYEVVRVPFSASAVRKRMEHVIARYRHQWELEKEISNQLKTLEEKTIQLKESNLGIFRILYTISEYHDTDSTNRSHRIKEYTHVLLKYVSQNYPEYGLEDRQMEKIEYASSLLDIGKLALPENILQKSSKLTMEELDLVKQHTVKGCEIIDKMAYLEDKEFLRYCYEICRYHHERYDGSGYPDRLQGEEIPISAQVVSVVCTYDFLLSSSSYKSSVTPNKAFHMVVDGECGSFSPKLLRCFTLAKNEIEEITDYMNLQKIQK